MDTTQLSFLPAAPTVIADHDIANRVRIHSPNEQVVKEISVLLAGFTPITDEFIEENQRLDQSFQSEQYPVDGYTLLFEFLLKDRNKIGMCISKTADTLTDKDEPYICFGLSFDSQQTPHLQQMFTQNLQSASEYYDLSIAAAKPTWSQFSQNWNQTCGGLNGESYIGAGVSQCWGISSDAYLDPTGYVYQLVYLFLPIEGVDRSSYGYRWQVGDEVFVRVIGDGIGNRQTKVTLNQGAGGSVVVFTLALLFSIII